MIDIFQATSQHTHKPQVKTCHHYVLEGNISPINYHKSSLLEKKKKSCIAEGGEFRTGLKKGHRRGERQTRRQTD